MTTTPYPALSSNATLFQLYKEEFLRDAFTDSKEGKQNIEKDWEGKNDRD
jgi:hypothetical protein